VPRHAPEGAGPGPHRRPPPTLVEALLLLAAGWLAVVGTLLLPTPSATGQSSGSDAGLGPALARVVRDSGLASKLGVHVVDIRGDRELFAHRADVPMNPASNQKLLTAAAALRYLGPDHRTRTALLGRIGDGGRIDVLTLRGAGDPMLQRADLVALADELVDRGVRSVGAIRVDATYFDEQTDPPAFAQQPQETAPFRAPVSAVAVERNAFPLRLLPGPRPGAPARVRIPGRGHFVIDNRLTTAADGPPRVIADQRPTDDGRLSLRLSGTLPIGILGVTYRRRVEFPRRFAGWVLADALGQVGIETPEDLRVSLGATPGGVPMLASRRSPPLAVLLRELGKDSDNFVAEMLLKVVAAETEGTPATTAAGCRRIRALLREAGADDDGVELVNGSGLFDGNAVPPRVLTRLLTHVHRQPGIRPEYLAHLATAGVDGTLARRLRDLPDGVSVRAKTGTLADVASLSGYVLVDGGDDRAWAFSILANDVPGQVGRVRRVADDLVRVLTAHALR